jgi:rhodanese-related sulfurtransferase
MKKILTFIFTIFLSLSFHVQSVEIEIITDKPGTGKKIIQHSWVQLEYTGSFENGKVFDTNIGKDRPLVVQMSMKEVIPGFEQGIIGTTKGTKRKIKIPAELAYGKKGGGDIIPPNTDLIFEFEVIDVLDPSYKSVSSDELIDMIENNAVALDIRTEEEWDKTGVIKGSFPETAFDKNGKSQDVNLIFISHDGETASMLANSFSEDLGFTNISVLKGGIKAWQSENKKLGPHK